MKKYYFITICSIICIIIIQFLYIQNLYRMYILEQEIQIKKTLVIAFDQEVKERRHNSNNQDLAGRKFTLKRIEDMTHEELDSLLRIEPIPTDTIDLDRFIEEGIILTKEEGMTLIDQDFAERDGKPFDLSALDSIFHSYYAKDFPYSLTLLTNTDKKVIDSTGNLDKASADYKSRLLPIGTKGEKRVQLKMDFPFSYFILHEVGLLILAFIMGLFVLLCLIVQLIVIRIKSERLKRWETNAHGTIHDLKAPLNSTVMLLSLIKQSEAKTERKELIGRSILQMKRLAHTINALLLVEQKNNRKLVLHKSILDLKELAEQIKEELEILYQEKPHQIKISSSSSDVEYVKGDKMYIENVLRNLIENALKYSDNGVIINVNIGINAHHQMEVDVEDNGWGVEPKYRKNLFALFYQVPRENERMQKGHGIGLAQSKLIIEAHGV